MATFRDLLDTGAEFAWVFHVSGTDWAATTSPQFAAWLNGGGAADNYRDYLFGGRGSGFDAVQIFAGLEPDLGSQRITSYRDGAIDVGSWSVSVHGERDDYTFGARLAYDIGVSGYGPVGLTFQPTTQTVGVRWAKINADTTWSKTNQRGTIKWSALNDYGLYDFINDNGTAGYPTLLWIGSCCVSCAGAIDLTDGIVTATCVATQLGTPPESVFYRDNFAQLISSVPLSLVGMTANLYAVPWSSKSGALIGSATEVPFLVRTGKVQTNLSDSGDGTWKIPVSGFTNQLKYRTSADRFSGTLSGFTFTRQSTPGYRGVWQQPHITLRAWQTGVSYYHPLSNGEFESAFTDWTFSASCAGSASSGTVFSGGGSAQIWNTGAAADRYIYQTCLTTGSRCHITGYARGDGTAYPRVSNGATTLWTGSTAASWQRFDVWFDATDSDVRLHVLSSGSSSDTAWFDSVEIEQSIAIEYRVWLCDAGDTIRFDGIDELKNAIIVALNSAQSFAVFTDTADGDIRHDTEGVTFYAFGPACHVAGVGFLPARRAGALMLQQTALTAPCQYDALLSEEQWDGGSQTYGDVCFVGLVENSFDSESAKLTLENTYLRDDEGSVTVNSSVAAVRNRAQHEYYLQRQYDLDAPFSEADNWPEDDDDAQLVYYRPLGTQALEVGYQVALYRKVDQQPVIRFTVTSDAAAYGAVRKAAIKALLDDGTYAAAGTFKGGMLGLGWAKGLADLTTDERNLITTDSGIDVVNVDASDPFAMHDSSIAKASTPVTILKQLLGSQDDITGIAQAVVCTSVNNLWGYYPYEREIIDWTSLQAAVDDAGLNVTYAYDTAGASDVDVLTALKGLCQTHGIRMIWGYSEAQRTWVLSFRPMASDAIGTAIQGNRVIGDNDIVIGSRPSRVGGDYSYSGITLALKDSAGVDIQLAITDASGRAQHSTAGRVFSISDRMTIPAAGNFSVLAQLNTSLGSYLLRLAQISGRVRVPLKLSQCTRIACGDIHAVTASGINNPDNGRRSGNLLLGDVVSEDINLSRNASVSAEIEVSSLQLLGIGPSMYVENFSRTDAALSVTSLDGQADFVSAGSGLTDLATFGCWSYDAGISSLVQRNCGCGDYACWIVRVDPDTSLGLYQSGANQNVWSCTIAQPTASTIAAGTAEITLGTGYASFPSSDDGNRYVLIFADRDNAGLQPCQHQYYGYLGDDVGEVSDSDGGKHPAIRIG